MMERRLRSSGGRNCSAGNAKLQQIFLFDQRLLAGSRAECSFTLCRLSSRSDIKLFFCENKLSNGIENEKASLDLSSPSAGPCSSLLSGTETGGRKLYIGEPRRQVLPLSIRLNFWSIYKACGSSVWQKKSPPAGIRSADDFQCLEACSIWLKSKDAGGFTEVARELAAFAESVIPAISVRQRYCDPPSADLACSGRGAARSVLRQGSVAFAVECVNHRELVRSRELQAAVGGGRRDAHAPRCATMRPLRH